MQPLPVEAEVGANARIVRNAQIVFQKELFDRFHEIERKENSMEKKTFPGSCLSDGNYKEWVKWLAVSRLFSSHGSLDHFMRYDPSENDGPDDGELQGV